MLDVEPEAIAKKASDTSKGGVTLKRQLSRDRAQQLKAMKAEYARAGSDALNGLYLEEESKRYYPMGRFASQLIGLTTIDGVGQAGLEQALDRYLSGREGRVLQEIDGKGRALGYGESEYIAAVNGGSVTLTIDASIQSFAEQAAREALRVNDAKAVRVLAMDPHTGEILALVNKPDFDLNDPPRGDVDALTARLKNRVVTDAYEPGSTFKILTAAAALDAGLVTPAEGFYCSGSVTVDGGRIKCWGKPHGAETFAQALQNSCNPVFVEMGLRLGTERFYDYLDAFGIGQKTGVDIPGEAGGIVIRESAVKRVDLARIGFGQSVAVTPMQLLTAACAVINGGNLMKPYVVSEITDAEGNVVEKGAPEVVGHPISEADLRHHAGAAGGRGHPGRRQERLPARLPRGRQDRHGPGVRGRRGVLEDPHRLVRGLRPGQRPADRADTDRGRGGRARGLRLRDRRALRAGHPGAHAELPGRGPGQGRAARRDTDGAGRDRHGRGRGHGRRWRTQGWTACWTARGPG